MFFTRTSPVSWFPQALPFKFNFNFKFDLYVLAMTWELFLSFYMSVR